MRRAASPLALPVPAKDTKNNSRKDRLQRFISLATRNSRFDAWRESILRWPSCESNGFSRLAPSDCRLRGRRSQLVYCGHHLVNELGTHIWGSSITCGSLTALAAAGPMTWIYSHKCLSRGYVVPPSPE